MQERHTNSKKSFGKAGRSGKSIPSNKELSSVGSIKTRDEMSPEELAESERRHRDRKAEMTRDEYREWKRNELNRIKEALGPAGYEAWKKDHRRRQSQKPEAGKSMDQVDSIKVRLRRCLPVFLLGGFFWVKSGGVAGCW